MQLRNKMVLFALDRLMGQRKAVSPPPAAPDPNEKKGSCRGLWTLVCIDYIIVYFVLLCLLIDNSSLFVIYSFCS